jgi:hypothetical protein
MSISRPKHPTDGDRSTIKRAKPSDAAAKRFVAERRQSLAKLTDADVERISQAAIARVDAAKTLREAQALREQRGVPTGPSIRRHSKRNST